MNQPKQELHIDVANDKSVLMIKPAIVDNETGEVTGLGVAQEMTLADFVALVAAGLPEAPVGP